jgi:hypothetical protein
VADVDCHRAGLEARPVIVIVNNNLEWGRRGSDVSTGGGRHPR